jgi:uncharacterized protein (TIGR03546 family)
MTLLLKQIFGLLKLLNSDTGTNQIAAGIAAGFVLGMTPSFSLQTIIIIFLILIFRIQIGAVFLSAFFCTFFAYILDPVFVAVGNHVLEMDILKDTFIMLYNLPIIPFTRFNNSLVMGSGIVAFLLSPIVFLLTKVLIKKYREKVLDKLSQTKLWNAVKATSLFQWYYKYDKLYN